jgi:hypothetical protein
VKSSVIVTPLIGACGFDEASADGVTSDGQKTAGCHIGPRAIVIEAISLAGARRVP